MILSSINTVLSIAGAIGLFLLGMKMMSEAIQSIGGRRLRAGLNTMTSSRGRGLFSGFAITGLLQSSSAITVLTVMFVDTSFLSLNASTALIFGANIGTTVTGWLVSLFGFRINITSLALPIIGIAFPLLFMGSSRRRKSGEFLIGFSLLFLGLMFIGQEVPDFQQIPALYNFLGGLAGHGILSLILFVLIGSLLTALMQSSSAMMALTIILTVKGWIAPEMAAAMILGENIGTTVTANLAAIIASRNARIAARFHFVINLIGSIWALIFIYQLLDFSSWATTTVFRVTPNSQDVYYSSILAVFHTSFNLLNTAVLVGFTPLLLKLSSYLVISGKGDIENTDSIFLSSWMTTPELKILQVRHKIVKLGKQVHEMFNFIPVLLVDKNEKNFARVMEKLSRLEEDTDEMERVIASDLTQLSKQGLSSDMSRHTNTLLRVIDDLESIGDAAFIMSNHIADKNKNNRWFTQEMRNKLDIHFDLTMKALDLMTENLSDYENGLNLEEELKVDSELGKFHEELMKMIEKNRFDEIIHKKTRAVFTDLVELSARVGSYCINIGQLLSNINKEDE